MLCQRCEKKTATVHLTRFKDGHKEELYLCSDCAGDEEVEFPFAPFSLAGLIGELLGGGARPAVPDLQCRGCGLCFREFSRKGLLGCPRCYDDFSGQLDPLLRRMHGSVRHVGKQPLRRAGAIGIRRKLEELRHLLQEAVAHEEYEKAARLRDQIRELERKKEQ